MLLGIQPMMGPVGKIFTLRPARLSHTIVMTKAHYQVFLRLNNRKKNQTGIDFKKAKYPNQMLPWTLTTQECTDRIHWCNEQFGEYGYVYDSGYVYNSGLIWFENENDLIAYKFRWY
jgi:hypothetical protein